MSDSPVPHRRPPVDHVEVRCRSALNRVEGMWFRWSLNPYRGCIHRCTFCYVRAFERRAERDSGEGYGRTVHVKVNVVEVLRAELTRTSCRGQLVALGTATDPYQPAEGRYRLTRGCLEALREVRSPVSITTRGPLVVRDADLLAGMARRAPLTVAVSVPTLDEAVWRTTEPGTAPPLQRLRALTVLAARGIHAGVLMAPLLPGLSDDPERLAAVARAARDAGAAFLGAAMLTLKPGVREHFLEALERDWPLEARRYAALYHGRPSLPASAAAPALQCVTGLRTALGIADRRTAEDLPPPPPVQLGLDIGDGTASRTRHWSRARPAPAAPDPHRGAQATIRSASH